MPHLVRLRWATSRIAETNRIPHGFPGPLIISLTSYPNRYPTLDLTLKALLTQRVCPDKVILWIADEDYNALPRSVLDLQSNQFEIGKSDNLRSYLKIIPTLRRHPNAFIVTADDDVYYHPTWLEELVTAWRGRDDETVCHRAHRIAVDAQGNWRPYPTWALASREPGVSTGFFATGVGGVLYPPNSLHPMCCDEDVFLKLCPQADDIWLYWMTRMAGSRVNALGWKRNVMNWRGSQASSLYGANVIRGGNERQLRAMASHFGWPSIDDHEPAI